MSTKKQYPAGKRARPKAVSAKALTAEKAARAAEMKELAEWVGTRMTSIDEYEVADADVQAQLFDDIEDIEDYLYGENCLNSSDKLVQRTAWLAYFRHQLGRKFDDHDKCRDMFQSMVDQHMLVKINAPDPKADLPGGVVRFKGTKKPASIYGRSFNLPKGVSLLRPDVLEFRRLWQDLRERTQTAVRAYRQKRMVELEEKATISPEQACAGKLGLFILDVPPHQVPDKKLKGKMFTHQGCRLLINSVPSRLLVVDVVNEVGVGGMGVAEAKVREMISPHPLLIAEDILVGGKENGLLSGMIVRGLKATFNPTESKAKKSATAKPRAKKVRKAS